MKLKKSSSFQSRVVTILFQLPSLFSFPWPLKHYINKSPTFPHIWEAPSQIYVERCFTEEMPLFFFLHHSYWLAEPQFLNQGSNPGCWQWKYEVLTTGSSGESRNAVISKTEKMLTQQITLLCVCVSCLVVSDSLQPHRLQPTRPLCPWDSLGKNTGVGYHFLLQKKLQKETKWSRSVMSDSLRPHRL